MCHVCHIEEYVASSRLQGRKTSQEASEDEKEVHEKIWRHRIASAVTQTTQWSPQQHRPPQADFENNTAVPATKRHGEDVA